MKSKVKILIRTMSVSLSPAPGGISRSIADRVSHGKLSMKISFEERRVPTASDNGIMTAVDLIVVEETTFVNS